MRDSEEYRDVETNVVALEAELKVVRDRVFPPNGETLWDNAWAFLVSFGFLLFLGGLSHIIWRGVDVYNFALVLVGGAATYRWHLNDQNLKRDKEVMGEIEAELNAERRKLRLLELRS